MFFLKKVSTRILYLFILFQCVFLYALSTISAKEIPCSNKIPPRYYHHRVKKGDTLWRIARYYDIQLCAVASENDLADIDKVVVGQVLKIPMHKRQHKISNSPFQWPVSGEIVAFYKEKVSGEINKGIDIKPAEASTVYASHTGVVEFSEPLKGYGVTVILKHKEGFNTVYSNLAKSFIKKDQQIKARQPIGEAGKSLRTDTTYVHFEIRKSDAPVNPLHYMP